MDMAKKYNLGIVDSGILFKGAVNIWAKPGIYQAVGLEGTERWWGVDIPTSLEFLISGGETLLIEDATVKVTQNRIITKTEISGRSGTIKEYICDKDYDLEITCGVTHMSLSRQRPDTYPLHIVRQLVELSRRPESVEVACKFLEDVFDIRRIAITQSIVDRQSGGNRQVVVLKGLSDDDYMLYHEKF